MSAKKNKRFPTSARKRYADLVLRAVYQGGGAERYVPLHEIEDRLGLEPDLILELCRKHLLGEIHVAWRAPAELVDGAEYQSAVEKQLIRDWFARPHLRIRPDAVRLTEVELVKKKK